MAELNQYMNKAFDYEEQGYVEEAVQLCRKCMQAFPEYKNEIEFEIAKMNYRNGKKEHALEQFLTLYQETGMDEIHDLVLEAYYGERRQEFQERYQVNHRQLENYPHFFGNREDVEICYYPIFVGENYAWYYDSIEKLFQKIQRNRIAIKEPKDAICIASDLLWMEDILLSEKMTREINPLMDGENALLLVYQRETWELLLQLVDLEKVIKLDRIVFYGDRSYLKRSLLEVGVLFPTIVIGKPDDKISMILNEASTEFQKNKMKYQNQIWNYCSVNGETVVKNIKEGRPKILFWVSRFTVILQYHIRDCKMAAERLGWKTELIIEKDRLGTGNSELIYLKK